MNFRGLAWSFSILQLGVIIMGYDLKLDDQIDARFWKFRGNYVYSNTLVEGGSLANLFNKSASDNSSIAARGVWYFQYSSPTEDNDNVFEISHRLTHALMNEIWVRLLAHPSVEIKFHGPDGEKLDSFHSPGGNWCDAFYSQTLLRAFTLSMNLTQPGAFVLVDKVVLGIHAPVAIAGSTIMPCIRDTEHSASVRVEKVIASPTTSPVRNGIAKKKMAEFTQLPGVEEEAATIMLTRTSRGTNHSLLSTSTKTFVQGNDASCTCSCTCSKSSSAD